MSSREKAVILSHRSAAYLKLENNSKGIKSDSISGPIDHSDFRYKALSDAKQSLELSPLWWRAYHLIGCAYHALNKFPKAIFNFDRALAIEPTKQEVKDARDESRFKLGIEQHFEHLDETHSPQATEEHLKQVNKNGSKVTPEMFKMMDKIVDLEDITAGDVIRGHRHYHGMAGFKQDYEMSAKYFAKAARNGNAEGLYNLAQMTSKGEGVKQDHNLAIKLLEEAAKQPPKKGSFPNIGVAEAQHALGLRYEEGVGVSKDLSMALHWYSKASENGCAEAANNLGLMYSNGNGVDRNLKKAEQYFILSSTRKDPNAMENLAYLYLELRDPESARNWYERAINNGNGHAKVCKEDFEKQALTIESEMEQKLKNVEQQKLNFKDLSLKESSEIISSSIATVPEEKKESFEEFEKYLQSKKAAGLPIEFNDGPHKYDMNVIEKYAENGSLFAIRMRTAMNYFIDSLFDLMLSKESKDEIEKKNYFDRKFVENFANCIREEEIVAKLSSDLRDFAIEIVDKILQSEGDSKSQLDIDARICYAYFHSYDMKQAIDFLKQCTEKYPKESFLYRLSGCLYGFTKEYKKGLHELNRAMKLKPNDYEIMYQRAAMMRLVEECDHRDILESFRSFLKTAPKDHRKFPETYYAMAFCLKDKNSLIKMKLRGKLNLSKELISEMKSYYEKGLEAEKIQLPFFLPYQSNNKSLLALTLKNFEIKPEYIDKKNSKKKSTFNPIKILERESRLTDPHRIELIVEHREYLNQVRELKTDRDIVNATPALQKQKAPKSLLRLKPITLRDMGPTEDYVYEGFFMQITFIEDAIFNGSSIVNVIEDENGDTQRCFIYNFEHENNDSIVQQTFGFGFKMSLINPYMRMAYDGKPGIRIDNPKSLVKFSEEEKIVDMCRYCCKGNAKMVCSRCKRAQYCDKNCQTNDWKLYKHKLTCIKSN